MQAAGRALRKADGKKLGYIIIPIYHSQKTKKEDVIAGVAFKRLIDVIKAMADHDERLQDEIDAIASGKKTLKSDSKIDYIEKGISNDQASNIKESPIKFLNFNEDLKQYYFAEIIEKASDGWNFNLQKLVDWLKEHNGAYPNKDENINLYAWVNAQRTFKSSNKLSPERINKLNEINFIWDQQENSWNEKYQKLIDWKNNNPNPLKWPSQKSREPIGRELGIWFLGLRKQYKEGLLTEERFNKLLAINFPFEPHSDKWLIKYEKLKEFISENSRFPSQALDKKELGQDIWLRSQIDKFSKLSKHQQKLLEEINYQDFENQFNSWEKSYDKLIEFIQKNKRLPKLDRGQEEKNIYTWLLIQRSAFRKNELKKDRVDLLLALEFVNDFFQLKDGERQARSLKKSLDRCEELAEFRKNNPTRWPSMKSSSGKQEKELANWLGYIKNWYKGRLEGYNEFPKELHDELLKIGFDFSSKIQSERMDWQDSYNKVLKILKNGSALDKKSYTWFANQKAFLKRKGNLDLDKKQKIEFLESLRNERMDWQDRYNKILELLENGDALDKKSYIWLANQKSRLKNDDSDLDKKQKIEFLESLRKSK